MFAYNSQNMLEAHNLHTFKHMSKYGANNQGTFIALKMKVNQLHALDCIYIKCCV